MTTGIVLTRPLATPTSEQVQEPPAELSPEIINGQPVIAYEDSTRSEKTLSAETVSFTWSDNLSTNGEWLYIAGVSNANSGHIMPLDGTITMSTGHCANVIDDTSLEIFINNETVARGAAGAFLTGANAQYTNTTIDIDFVQGDKIRLKNNGGRIEHLPFLVRSLERSGVSAIIMEDKVGLKKNSLFKNQKNTKQDKPQLFANKIMKICNSRQSQDFMVIARIESFIVGKGLNDALKRAEIYSKAGADAILIHSKQKTPSEIFSFAKEWKKNQNFKPLVSVPSTYSKVYEKDLIKNGFKLVIYANQLLRAAYPAMKKTAKTILKNSRAFEADKKIIPIKEIINLIKND